jgi:hypothetical protein
MAFNADEIRRLSDAKRPAAEAEERKRRREEALESQRKEAEGHQLLKRIEDEAARQKLDEASRAIESAAQAGKTVCDYHLDQAALYGIHSLFGYKGRLRRGALLSSSDRTLYDSLKSKGFSVDIVNVNAQYPNSHHYVLRVSW